MKARRDGNFLIMGLEDGEDLFSSLGRALSTNNITSGIILTGTGMLRDFEIGYYNGIEYLRDYVKEPHELVAMHGSISTIEGELNLHIHAALANREHNIIGGHLFSGKVKFINEISIVVLDNVKLTKIWNERLGLALLDFLD